MFKFPKKDKRTLLDKEIEAVIAQMAHYPPESEEYSAISQNLERLYKARAHSPERIVSPDTVMIVAGNLIGIGLIMGYERAHIITSKALSFVIKGRL